MNSGTSSSHLFFCSTVDSNSTRVEKATIKIDFVQLVVASCLLYSHFPKLNCAQLQSFCPL